MNTIKLKWLLQAAALLFLTSIMTSDLLNDKVLPLCESEGVDLIRILTDRGTQFCARPERHDFQLFLAINDIEHTRTKAYRPQTNGICDTLPSVVGTSS